MTLSSMTLSEWGHGFLVGVFGGAGGLFIVLLCALALRIAHYEVKHEQVDMKKEDDRG